MKNHTEESEDQENEFSEENYRACAIYFLGIVKPAIAHVLAAKTPEIGWSQLLFALGLEDRPMHEVAAQLCVETACISKGAKEFVRANNLPTPSCMKSDAASQSYREARTKQLTP